MTAVDTARARAHAVLRVRGRAVAAAALPAACAVVLLAGRFTGHIGAPGSPDAALWDGIRWAVCAVAALTLLLAALVARAHRRAVPPVTPAVPLERRDAPELYRLIEELADRLDVPAPAAIALTPDCDSWLEEPHDPRHRAAPAAPVLVIGSPFLWWMRAGELRALLAPVVAGTAAAADPDIAAARRWLRTLDASLGDRRRGPAALVDLIDRRLLGACREHAAELEHAVAAWASEQANAVDYGLRIAAQEQVGLAYAGWDRLLTRVALPAWRLGRHPAHLNAGVVSALTELSRRDRLAADGYENRLGDRPSCDLLEEPGLVDARVSRLAAELLHEEPAEGWQPLDWEDYPNQVVVRGWRAQAAALQAALGEDRPHTGPALDKLLARLAAGEAETLAAALAGQVARGARVAPPLPPVRSGRDLLVEHLTATVCCAAVDAGTAAPGLDWLDGPVLLSRAAPRAELAPAVALAVEDGQDGPLLAWLERAGVRLERPVRLSG
ncbi:hypothetical protein [Streptomyces sp. TLI_171]|uniref:hypothetical protein n=1 Tax=Streptomyces sp. TLI_171 TaxID=1938859 RepID=UPI000C19A4D9|nr:hypothetical protein [Streptomyces sp. TLI_171]RKE20237.1 hypothetical protein BX266_3590 [Streptomyces sp. TLI_171]